MFKKSNRKIPKELDEKISGPAKFQRKIDVDQLHKAVDKAILKKKNSKK